MEILIYSFKCLLLQWLQLLLSKCKQIQKSVFSGCKNRICHHKFKVDAWNNGWTKKEVRIFIRISVISGILLWLDYNRQLSPWDISYIALCSVILNWIKAKHCLALTTQSMWPPLVKICLSFGSPSMIRTFWSVKEMGAVQNDLIQCLTIASVFELIYL